jgi:hypothetical protein
MTYGKKKPKIQKKYLQWRKFRVRHVKKKELMEEHIS